MGEMQEIPQQDIPKFYAGRSVFITGATGFMGKVLLHRLLTTCPDIGDLYLLLREKRGRTPEMRLEELKQSIVFDSLRQSHPAQLEKLVLVPGDVTSPLLGLSQESLLELREVSLVFHSAATVRFTEDLKVAVDQNLRPVIRLMDICEALPSIQALVHISTAYCNSERSHVEERVYPTHMEVQELLHFVDNNPASRIEAATERIIAPKPNTYTFTKAMAEKAIVQRAFRKYPVAIFRPTIVVSALSHPYPGWLDNLNGPTVVVAGAGTGLLRVSPTEAGARVDLVPVDVAVDTLIAVAWETVLDSPSEVRVYNCTTIENPVTWGQFQVVINRTVVEYPFSNACWYPHIQAVPNRFTFKTWELLLHTVPHYLAEYVARILGFQPRQSLIKASRKIRAINKVTSFFTLREWDFSNGNVVRLRERLSERDRDVFNLDPKTIVWEKYLTDYVKGTRKYALKQTDQDLDLARKKMQRLYYLHNGLKFLLMLLFLATLLKTRIVRDVLYRIILVVIGNLGYGKYGLVVTRK